MTISIASGGRIVGYVVNSVEYSAHTVIIHPIGGGHARSDVRLSVLKSDERFEAIDVPPGSFSDKEGQESIVIATPNHLKILLIEKADETGRSMITLYSENGDMFFSAPAGRIHFRSKYFSREVG